MASIVPNRLNYIHWIEDLLALDIFHSTLAEGNITNGFDIGTGANCIYPLLGASVLGWKFVGSDITDIAVEWANKNVESNPHLSHLIEIRRAGTEDEGGNLENNQICSSDDSIHSGNPEAENAGTLASSALETRSNMKYYNGPPQPVLLGVVKDNEHFDFCMCNPPFFETMEEAGLNPKTSCGGTPDEMVCFCGEHAFVTRIIEDSVKMKDTFRWYSSMLGRKLNLNILVSELWKVGATVVKTTEFVQGMTSRWGLAWSFLPVSRKLSSHKVEESNLSFMLEITVSRNKIDAVLETETCNRSEAARCGPQLNTPRSSNDNNGQDDRLSFRVSVFQQHPGALLVRGTLLERSTSISVKFSTMFRHLEEILTEKLCPGRVSMNRPSSNTQT